MPVDSAIKLTMSDAVFMKMAEMEIEKVIFNDPATIVIWIDGSKTVVKCQDGDIFDRRTGLLMAIAKKCFGNTGRYNDIIDKWVDEPERGLLSVNIERIKKSLTDLLG